ncbi:GAF domain-containing protein [Sorangium sp. So ce134]
MHARRASFEPWLRSFVEGNGGIAGTVHLVEGDALALAAAVNIPEKVQEITRLVPRGKGMAGLAWERGQPVQTCNLQTDASGDVRPGARAVAAQAAVALPVQGPSASVRAVVGIAFAGERELGEDELARLAEGAGALPA